MPKYINGPTNYVQLYGKINNVDKNFYLFMDNHKSIDNQTKCKSFDSIDIPYYLYRKIKYTTEEIDFFMEILQMNLDKPITTKKEIYITEVLNLFRSEFSIEKINDKDIVKYSKTNNKVRLHYLDIRYHMDLFYILDLLKFDFKETLENLFNNNNNTDKLIKILLQYIEIISNFIKTLDKNKYELLNKKDNETKEYDKLVDKQKYYLNKILNKYDNIELKNKINIFIENNYTFIFDNLTKFIYKLTRFIKYYDTKNIMEIKKLVDIIYETIIDIYSLFTDAYLLRRILDKNYTKKSIIYSGSQHSLNYIYFLVKYFDFKIVKIHKSNEKNADEILKSINNTNIVYDIYRFFIDKEKPYEQCIIYESLFTYLDK